MATPRRLDVEVVTPDKLVVKMVADEVIAPGADGLFGVRPGHTQLLAVLRAGPLTVRDGTHSTVMQVTGGFVEAGPAKVRVLADSVVTPP